MSLSEERTLKSSTGFKERTVWSLIAAAVGPMGEGVFIPIFQFIAGLDDPAPAHPYGGSDYILIIAFTLFTPGLMALSNIVSLPGRATALFAATWAVDRLGWRPSVFNRIVVGLVVNLVPAISAWLVVLRTGREPTSAAPDSFFSVDPFVGTATVGVYQLTLGLGCVAATGLVAGLMYRACETGQIARLLQPKPPAPQP